MGNAASVKRYREKNLEKVRQMKRDWAAVNKERITNYGRKYSRLRNGFTEDRFALAVAVQDNACAICRTSFEDMPARAVHADHDHQTNAARGVLCHHCNVGLGVFKDSPELLTAAMRYLANPTVKETAMLEPKVEELKAAVEQNTVVLRELIAALTAAGALQTAQASAAAHSSPAVQAVVKAQKAADAKKSDAKPTAEAAPPASGEPSAPTGESSSSEPTGLQAWAEKTAAKFAELKDAAPDLDNVRKAVLGINALIGREQATAVLGRFGVQAVTAKENKTGLDESQYPEFFTLCLEVLSGAVDATASLASE